MGLVIPLESSTMIYSISLAAELGIDLDGFSL